MSLDGAEENCVGQIEEEEVPFFVTTDYHFCRLVVESHCQLGVVEV